MKEKAIVVLNEQHSLMDQQRELLDTSFPEGWEVFPVPAEGWSLDQMRGIVKSLLALRASGEEIVFASPVPYLILSVAWESGEITGRGERYYGGPYLFHNDRREKKELPGGKIIQVVAQTGWKLVNAV